MGLTHLSFADDILVFTDGNVRSVDGIQSVFDEFTKMSGLRISLGKSTIYVAWLDDRLREDMEARYHFDMGLLPVRYLGLPLRYNGLFTVIGKDAVQNLFMDSTISINCRENATHQISFGKPHQLLALGISFAKGMNVYRKSKNYARPFSGPDLI